MDLVFAGLYKSLKFNNKGIEFVGFNRAVQLDRGLRSTVLHINPAKGPSGNIFLVNPQIP